MLIIVIGNEMIRVDGVIVRKQHQPWE